MNQVRTKQFCCWHFPQEANTTGAISEPAVVNPAQLAQVEQLLALLQQLLNSVRAATEQHGAPPTQVRLIRLAPLADLYAAFGDDPRSYRFPRGPCRAAAARQRQSCRGP